jgi:uncharacterized protein
MYDNQSKGISYTGGFFILIVFVLGGAVLAGALNELVSGMASDNVNVLRSMQAVSAIMSFFLPALITANVLHRQPMQLLGFTGRIRREQVGLIVLITGTALIVSTSLSYFNNHLPIPESWKIAAEEMENTYNERVLEIVNMRSVTDYIIALVVMAFIPALCEETLFRGGLQNFLSRGTGRPWLAIVIVSLLFSLAHFSYYGFLSRFFLGIVLGAMFHYSGRLWLNILAHFLNNALALTILFDYTQKGKPLRDAMKSDPTTWWGILILPVVIGLFILFKRVSDARRRMD